jgi:hypothetical protein
MKIIKGENFLSPRPLIRLLAGVLEGATSRRMLEGRGPTTGGSRKRRRTGMRPITMGHGLL